MCKAITVGFLLLYALALVVWLFGLFGWWGAKSDPLAGVFLVLIGQPWTRWVSALPEFFWVPGLLLAPTINLILLKAACRLFAAR